MTTFFLAYFNFIVLAVLVIFYLVIVARVLRPHWVKNISYAWLISIAISIHLLYGAAATWLQYVVFSKSEIGKVLVSIPLPGEVPFAPLLLWLRPFFDGAHGYFAFYAFQHFFLITVALFTITGLFTLFFKVYAHYRPALFKEGDIAIIALSFLMAGWYGAIVLVPLTAFFAAVIILSRLMFKKTDHVSLSAVFLATAPIAFVFAIPILAALSLYPLLKL